MKHLRALSRPLLAAATLFCATMLRGGDDADWPKTRRDTFDLVWDTINESYQDPTFGGVDWSAVKTSYEPRLTDAGDKLALRALLQSMLNELGKSHFSIMPQEAAVYTPEERTQVGTVGAEFTTTDGGDVVVNEIKPESAAAEAGLRPGDRIVRVAGRNMEEVRKLCAETGMTEARRDFYLSQFVSAPLSGPVGNEVEVEVEGADGKVRKLTLQSRMHTGEWSEPVGAVPSFPVDIQSRHEERVAYLRFNSFAPILMKDIRKFLREVRPDEGLVLDLRGNPGGLILMASGLCGWLSADSFSLGRMQMRAGVMNFDVYPQRNAFLGPVAVLIDNGSASSSEVLAAGLQEAGRARIFGENSAGAALPSSFLTLPTGDLLQYAVADLTTPKGATLEGIGVNPDKQVARSRDDIAAGRDPVLDAARDWIATELQTGKK